ncbi:hypothetical protein Cni_G08866 [Canna indica]|uniref:Uncharacterized protein n=1 Tax=Canna indica TaxID=4628 RepID=A0AAQ3K1H1_9LILI|nr:hypothetical protein Cni_G08866 [Canna indica]
MRCRRKIHQALALCGARGRCVSVDVPDCGRKTRDNSTMREEDEESREEDTRTRLVACGAVWQLSVGLLAGGRRHVAILRCWRNTRQVVEPDCALWRKTLTRKESGMQVVSDSLQRFEKGGCRQAGGRRQPTEQDGE